MSDPENPDQTDSAHRALKALREGDPEVTAKALLEALKDDPNRLDFLHALSVTQLQRGHPRDALEITIRGEELARGDVLHHG